MGFKPSYTPYDRKDTDMSKTNTLKAELRTCVGKGSSRQLRRNGLIPAVIYGNKQAPLAIAVSYKEIHQRIYAGGFKTTVTSIEVDGQIINVLPKDYQLDPVRDFPQHVDFLRIDRESIVEVDIPVHFLNADTAPGVKRGGTLNIVIHNLPVLAPATAIPEFIEVDIANLNIGDSIHIHELTLPNKVEIAAHFHETTVATIVGATSEEAETTSDSSAEVPVIGDKKPE